jgi:hypothetical protein
LTSTRHTVFLHKVLEQAARPFRIFRTFLLQCGYWQAAYVAHRDDSRDLTSQGEPLNITVELPRKKERGFQCRAHEVMLFGRNENGFETHGDLQLKFVARLYSRCARFSFVH